MSKFEDFKPGDHVHHIVIEGDPGFVNVRYEGWKSGGQYDRRWFELYENLLALRRQGSGA